MPDTDIMASTRSEINPTTRTPVEVASESEPTHISKFLDTSAGALISTFGNGLFLINPKDGTASKVGSKAKGSAELSSNKVFTAHELADGTVLVGTIRGLNQYFPETNTAAPVRPTDTESSFIESTQILSIVDDLDGNVWMGSQNAGLILWTAKDRREQRNLFRRVKTYPRLPSKTIYAMERADDGHIWFSTTAGLVRLEPKSQAIQVFDKTDGLQDDEFNFGASYKDSHGRLYFGGNRGFNRFHPNDVVIDTTPPPLRLTKVSIAGQEHPYDVSYAPIEEINLDYKNDSIDLEFSVLDFANPAANRYQYKLENFNDDWIELGTTHNLSFRNLPSGVFHLKLSGANSDGVWNHEGVSIPVKMHPPPWFRWWAFFGYESLLLGLLLLARNYYDKHQENERNTAHARQMERTANDAIDELDQQLEADQQLLQSVMDHNASILDIVATFLQSQADSIEDEDVRSTFAENRERLQCLQLLDKHLEFVGGTRELNLHRYLEDLFSESIQTVHKKGLEIVPINETRDKRLPANLAIPAGIIAAELIRNSLKHAFEGLSGIQTVSVGFEENQESNGWVLTVGDSGVGLPANINPELPETTGLEIVLEMAKRLRTTLILDREGGTRYTFRRNAIDH